MATRRLEWADPRARDDATAASRAAASRHVLLALAFVLAAATALAGVAVALIAHRAPLTSDESLYISEGLNIARGIGPKYTTGDFVQHRGFLFPAMLAVPLKLDANFTAVYWLTKTVAIADALVLGLLAARMFGRAAGVAAVALGLSNRFLLGMASTVYLDGTETLFLLLFLLALWEAHSRRSLIAYFAAGFALALAFLTKEAALLWFPLPAAFVLVTDDRRTIAVAGRRLMACYGTFAVAAGWWWPYVWAVDHRIYMWPATPRALALTVLLMAAALGGVITCWAAVARRSELAGRRMLRVGGLMLIGGWIAAFLFVMETTSWAYPWHIAQIPGYFRDVLAGNLAPWPLTAAAVIALFARSVRDARYRLIALAFALWMPFAIVVARRDFALRDLLPMVYLTYLVAGVMTAELLHWLTEQADGRWTSVGAAAIVLLGAGYFGAQQVRAYDDRSAAPAATGADWDNAMVRSTSSWIDANISPGTPIMSSRLYFSQLYIRTGARYPIAQVPTVNVVPVAGSAPYLQARSTLFRWEDRLLPAPQDETHWISIDAYSSKHYFTALSEDDLLREIRRRQDRYIVISGEDVAFSTTRYLDYFIGNPAFSLVHQETNASGAMYIFKIDAGELAARVYHTIVPASVLNDLYRNDRGAYSPAAFAAAIDPAGVTARPADGLLPELAAVIAH